MHKMHLFAIKSGSIKPMSSSILLNYISVYWCSSFRDETPSFLAGCTLAESTQWIPLRTALHAYGCGLNHLSVLFTSCITKTTDFKFCIHVHQGMSRNKLVDMSLFLLTCKVQITVRALSIFNLDFQIKLGAKNFTLKGFCLKSLSVFVFAHIPTSLTGSHSGMSLRALSIHSNEFPPQRNNATSTPRK